MNNLAKKALNSSLFYKKRMPKMKVFLIYEHTQHLGVRVETLPLLLYNSACLLILRSVAVLPRGENAGL